MLQIKCFIIKTMYSAINVAFSLIIHSYHLGPYRHRSFCILRPIWDLATSEASLAFPQETQVYLLGNPKRNLVLKRIELLD